MTAPAPVGVDDALQTLVQQFSDPLACLRELVQNSLDAGSRQVDVAFEYTDGVMCVRVDDYGEGMDRAIIDGRLTRLFSSAKDGDMTKIGRFGIGFVSVFALEPDAVCLDTGRGAENWRILFKADRSFSRIALDTPVDGTRVRIFKAVDRATFDDLHRRAREVLSYWCKHVDGELYFDDAPIAGPLAIDAVVQARHVEEGTEVIVGLRADGATFAGFYNKGLTLHETDAGPEALPGIVFKVSSRYLEHTLTRDNVLHDDQFERAMAIVRRLAEGPLLDALFDRLAATPTDEAAWAALDQRLAAGPVPAGCAKRAIFPAIPEPVSLTRLQAAKRCLVTDGPSALAALRAEAGDLILCVSGASKRAAERARKIDDLPLLSSAWLLAEQVEGAGALEAEIGALLGFGGAKLAGVRLARWGAALPERVALTAADPDAPIDLSDTRRLEVGFFERKRWLLINRDHPTVAQLLASAAGEPEWAAWLICKLFLLGDRLDVGLDSALAATATERRARRLA